jgi:hypothetical protein
MSETINSLREMAHQQLMNESFRYIQQVETEGLKELAIRNGIIRKTSAKHFFYLGEIHPQEPVTAAPMNNANAPPLHYSLYEDYDNIMKRSGDSGIIDVSNYFRAVLSYSNNGIVLDALLPSILVNHLKEFFTDIEYDFINYGGALSERPSMDETKKNIEDIIQHYKGAIAILREMLMNKLLLLSR